MAKIIQKNSQGIAALELIIVLVVLALLVFVGVQVFKNIGAKSGGNTGSANSTAESETDGPLKGVSLSPKSYGAADFGAFFGEAVKNGSAVTWAGTWTDLEKSSGAPFTVARLGKQYSYEPVIITGTHHESAGKLSPLQPMTDANKQRFVAALADFAAQYKPKYIGIGNEVNRINAKAPSDYAAFKTWFSEAAATVKQKSADTKVFVIFQYESLNGLDGGLFGGKNDESAADWQLLADFPAADLIAFTTYPYIIYKDPSEMPADYYSRINAHTQKPVAFTEIGWPSGTEAAGYESTPEEQAAFVSRFAELVADVNGQMYIWPFLYEYNLPKPFTTIGLIGQDGQQKPALAVWQGLEF